MPRFFRKPAAKCQDYNSEDIARTLCALATLPVRQMELGPMLCKEAATKGQGFHSEDVARMLWALATLKELQPASVS